MGFIDWMIWIRTKIEDLMTQVHMSSWSQYFWAWNKTQIICLQQSQRVIIKKVCESSTGINIPCARFHQNQTLFHHTILLPSLVQIHIICSFEHPPSLLAKSELRYNGLSRICIHKWNDIPAFILFGKVSILGKVENLKKKLLILFSRTILFLGMYRDWIWKQKERNTTKMLSL